MNELQYGQQVSRTDSEIGESFSVGLTLLDAACLTNSKDLYNLTTFKLDYYKLEERKQKLRSLPSYDDVIKQLIIDLAHPEHNMRLKCRDVFKWMEQYRSKINDM